MFEKYVKIFADAVATAVAREVAKQLPAIAEGIAGAVTRSILDELPDLGELDDHVRNTLLSLPGQIIAEVRKLLPFPFNR